MSAEEKAKELINTYYGCNNVNQAGAIRIVENVLLATIVQKIDSLHGHLFITKDFDSENVTSAIKDLKNWQEVIYAVGRIKDQIPV